MRKQNVGLSIGILGIICALGGGLFFWMGLLFGVIGLLVVNANARGD